MDQDPLKWGKELADKMSMRTGSLISVEEKGGS